MMTFLKLITRNIIHYTLISLITEGCFHQEQFLWWGQNSSCKSTSREYIIIHIPTLYDFAKKCVCWGTISVMKWLPSTLKKDSIIQCIVKVYWWYQIEPIFMQCLKARFILLMDLGVFVSHLSEIPSFHAPLCWTANKIWIPPGGWKTAVKKLGSSPLNLIVP